MTDQTAERLPDEVLKAVYDRLAEARNVDHPDNQHAMWGLTTYALTAALETAYAAGRASMLDEARKEYASRWHGQIMGHFGGAATESDVRIALDYSGITDAEIVTRRVVETEWQAVDGTQTGR